MLYLDYSATTPVSLEVLSKFIDNIDNDSILLDEERKKVQKLLNTNLDVLYTSGATESNNLAIKGVALNYLGQKKHIITTKLEHSSILEQMKFLEKNGFIIDYVPLENGIVTIENLKKMITDDTILVSICAVNSELGLRQPIEEIGLFLKNYKNIIFHSDMTQIIGKSSINLDNVDMASFTSHKFYGLKGIGVLLKRNDIVIQNLVFGKRNINKALVRSLSDALELALSDFSLKYDYVCSLNKKVIDHLKKYPNIKINSNKYSIPHIINISVDNFKPETFLHTLELYDIYISTKSACSIKDDYSLAVYEATNDYNLAKTSVRISLSYKTTEEDIKNLFNVFDKIFEM